MTAIRNRNSQILSLARKVCEAKSIAFSANDANQSLADMRSAEANVNESQLLDAVGHQVGIRFRAVEGSLRELIHSVIEVKPIIVAGHPAFNGDDEAGRFFVILRKVSPMRFEAFIDGEEKTVSHRWLRKNAAENENGNFHWFLAQPMFAAESASSNNDQTEPQAKPLSPLKRLIAFLRPEAHDMRMVFIFAMVVGILSLTTPLAVEALVNTIAFGKYLQPLIVLSLIVFVFLAFRAGLGVLMTVVVEIIQRRLFVRVVDDLALRLTRVPVSYLKQKHGPELVNRFFDVVNIQKITSKLLLESLMLILQTVIGLSVLAFYHPFLLGYDVGLIALMTVVLIVIGRGAVKTAKEESALKYKTAAWLQEIVRHPTTFKFNGGLDFAINRADELAAQYIQSRQDHFRILIRQVTFSMLMQAVAATVLLGLGGYLVIDGQMTLGQLVAAELIVTVILGSFAKIGKDLESFYDLLASVDKLGKLFDVPAEPANKLVLAASNEPSQITLNDLKFHNGNGVPITCEIPPGSTLAVVGRSGSGKSGLIETIAGLRTPNTGHVLLNESRVDLIDAQSLQSRIGFISDIEIFEGTIDENLCLGRAEIGSVEINQVIDRMGLHDVINNLHDGYKTRLSVSGFPLSSGQAIRLVVARALIAKPGVLLIDGLLDRLSDDDLDDMLARLSEYKTETTIVLASGRQAIADWASVKLTLSEP